VKSPRPNTEAIVGGKERKSSINLSDTNKQFQLILAEARKGFKIL
jgi:hypothetical protein